MVQRSNESQLLNVLADENNNSSNKPSLNQDLRGKLDDDKEIPLAIARQARRAGFIKRASADLYESASTGHFWRINKANNTIERVIDVNENGIVKESK